MADVMGFPSYLTLVDEVTWGTTPGSPTHIHTPVENYTVKLKSEKRKATPRTGLKTPKHGRNFRASVSGQLSASLYGWRPTGLTPSLAQYLMDWALSAGLEAADLPSKTAFWAVGPGTDDLQHKGLRVGKLTLQGSEQSGIVELLLDLVGQDEVTPGSSIPSLPNTRHKLREFQYSDCTFSLASTAVLFQSFSLSIDFGLQPNFVGQTRIQKLKSSKSDIMFSATPVKTGSNYTAMKRALTEQEFAGEIVMKGLHNGTGGVGTDYAVCTIAMPVLSFDDVEEQGDRDGLKFEQLNLQALKPDSSSAALSTTWTEE